MSSPQPRPQPRETMTYVVGYGLALLLTCAAFGLVYLHLLGGRHALYTVLGLGLVQMVVHFRCFLHIDLRRSARADLQLILFSALIIALMVGGTLIVLFNLRTRMM
jgi:cytochrome o ubiquinol oxidase operon protein cyoD